MSQYVTEIPDERLAFFTELFASLQLPLRPAQPVTPPALTTAEKEWVADLKEALHEVQESEAGRKQLLAGDEFLRKYLPVSNGVPD